MSSCQRCGNPDSIYPRPIKIDLAHKQYITQYLCKQCFCDWIETCFLNTIKSETLISPGDRVMVGLSGGKDSQLLLALLSKFKEKNSFELMAVSVDEGIKGYRDFGINIAQKTADQLKIPIYTFTYSEAFGLDLDDMLIEAKRVKMVENIPDWACAFCGTSRMRLVLRFALEFNCNVFASGRNLDDYVSDTLLRICALQGINYIKSFKGKFSKRDSGINVIHPLWNLTEEEIALYCHLNEIQYLKEPDCPYKKSFSVGIMRHHILAIEKEFPGFRHAFSKGVECIRDDINSLAMHNNKTQMKSCSICGFSYQANIKDICPLCDFQNRIALLGGHSADIPGLKEIALKRLNKHYLGDS